jgi:hypothetical protein
MQTRMARRRCSAGKLAAATPMTTALSPANLDLWVREYNEQRPHQGRWCFGKTPMQTFLDAMPVAKEKMIAG